ncbi:sugar phosphate isomerase/epimerase family protein [Microbacterium sp. A94]|uniref:sugar phosphate isomerase/epimerase family protein n=1 Tax=Microbacterium sp. A94 TaxID=3450717 RepID=UPI003F4241A2
MMAEVLADNGRKNPISFTTISTPYNSWKQDIQQAAAAGANGVGVWMKKWQGVPADQASESIAEAGLHVTSVLPEVFSLTARAGSAFSGPSAPSERANEIVKAIPYARDLGAQYLLVALGTHPHGEDSAPLRQLSAGLLDNICAVAADYGVHVGVELMAKRRGSFTPTLDSMVSFLDSLKHENIGIVVDTYHSFDDVTFEASVKRHVHRIVAAQVCDVPDLHAGPYDRVLPGGGLSVAPQFVHQLLDAGYRGWLELELLSDDGILSSPVPNSLWASMSHESMLAQGVAGLRSIVDAYR